MVWPPTDSTRRCLRHFVGVLAGCQRHPCRGPLPGHEGGTAPRRQARPELGCRGAAHLRRGAEEPQGVRVSVRVGGARRAVRENGEPVRLPRRGRLLHSRCATCIPLPPRLRCLYFVRYSRGVPGLGGAEVRLSQMHERQGVPAGATQAEMSTWLLKASLRGPAKVVTNRTLKGRSRVKR